MRAVILDDDIEFLKIMQLNIKEYFELEQSGWDVVTATDYREFSAVIQEQGADIVFLDIDMPEKSGIEVADIIRSKERDIDIIFLTNREDMVFQSIHYAPFRFIRKSKMREELKEAISAYVCRYREKNALLEYEQNNAPGSVPLKNIYYIDSAKHYLTLHMENENVAFRGKIADYEEFLQLNGFMRVQRSFIVNMMYIKNILQEKVIMANGDSVPVKRGLTDDIRKQYYEYKKNI